LRRAASDPGSYGSGTHFHNDNRRFYAGKDTSEAVLTFARNEPLDKLTVMVSVTDTTVSADIAVTVINATVDSVTVEPYIARDCARRQRDLYSDG